VDELFSSEQSWNHLKNFININNNKFGLKIYNAIESWKKEEKPNSSTLQWKKSKKEKSNGNVEEPGGEKSGE